MKLATFVADDIKWFAGENLTRRLSLVAVLEAIMSVMVSGGDGRAERNVMCVLLPLAAVLLLSVGVAASPEEQKPVQEQLPQEVQVYTF